MTNQLPDLYGQPPSSPAHLDPPETPVECNTCSPGAEPYDPAEAIYDTFRHSGWIETRRRIYRAMYDAGTSLARRNNYGRCGASWWIQRHRTDPTRFRTVMDRCHDRFCTPCSVDRRETVRRNLSGKLDNRPHRLLTLTIRHHQESLRDLTNRVMTCFRKLRQRALWKQRVTGGAAFLEVNYNADANTWHPHLHVILEGHYLPAPELRQAWLAITGDSKNVDISLIRDHRSVTNYVCKYATKPLPHSVTSHHSQLVEAIDALGHRRTIVTFGRWRNWRLTAQPDDSSWELYLSMDAATYEAAMGNQLASRVLAMITTADTSSREFFVDLDDMPPDQ